MNDHRQTRHKPHLRRRRGGRSTGAAWHMLQARRWAQRKRVQRNEAITRLLGPTPDPVWCVVANVVDEHPYGPRGVERRRGTKHFLPGAKVYCLKPLWDWYPYSKQFCHLMVIGRARKTHRYSAVVMRAVWLTHWRVQLVYSPHIIREMVRVNYERGAALGYTYADVVAKRWVWDGTPESRQLAEHIAQTMRGRVPLLRGE